MRRTPGLLASRLLLVTALLLGGLAGLGAPEEARACSGEPRNPAASADLIVVARVSELELLRFTGLMRFIEVELKFDVERYLLGSGPPRLHAIDDKSVEPGFDQARTSEELASMSIEDVDESRLMFSGAGGQCGALNEDPRGRYLVIGLVRDADGTLRTGHQLVYGQGESLDDEGLRSARDQALADIRAAGLQPSPATSGQAGLVRHGQRATGSQEIALGLAALVVVLLGRYASKDGGGR